MINSLGFDKEPAATRVVVAMSGGVDSSVAAVMLKKQGYDVIGMTMRLYDADESVVRKGACCAGKDIYDAKRIADEFGFPHYVLDYKNRFKDSVIEEFADSYMRGETPIPCVRCNQELKFKDMLETARDLGADCLVTGHYIRRIVNPESGRAELHAAVDPQKDQSYFLYATTQEQTDFLRFPLGDNTKEETRKLAHSFGIRTADKPDSQDICFVPDGDYASVVAKLRPEAMKKGKIVHYASGEVLGEHPGIINYTIGQRRGLRLGGGETKGDPLYVVGVNVSDNTVLVGPRQALAKRKIKITDINWLGDVLLSEKPQHVVIKFRSSMSPVEAEIILCNNGFAEITAENEQFGISPGQACVCYDGNRVLGGGIISETGN